MGGENEIVEYERGGALWCMQAGGDLSLFQGGRP